MFKLSSSKLIFIFSNTAGSVILSSRRYLLLNLFIAVIILYLCELSPNDLK